MPLSVSFILEFAQQGIYPPRKFEICENSELIAPLLREKKSKYLMSLSTVSEEPVDLTKCKIYNLERLGNLIPDSMTQLQLRPDFRELPYFGKFRIWYNLHTSSQPILYLLKVCFHRSTDLTVVTNHSPHGLYFYIMKTLDDNYKILYVRGEIASLLNE